MGSPSRIIYLNTSTLFNKCTPCVLMSLYFQKPISSGPTIKSTPLHLLTGVMCINTSSKSIPAAWKNKTLPTSLEAHVPLSQVMPLEESIPPQRMILLEDGQSCIWTSLMDQCYPSSAATKFAIKPSTKLDQKLPLHNSGQFSEIKASNIQIQDDSSSKIWTNYSNLSLPRIIPLYLPVISMSPLVMIQMLLMLSSSSTT